MPDPIVRAPGHGTPGCGRDVLIGLGKALTGAGAVRGALAVTAGTLLVGVLVTCQVDSLVNPPTAGTLNTSPVALSDSAAVGSTAPHTVSVRLSTTGATSVSWSASRAQGSAWLSLTATSGMAPDTVELSLVPVGLAVGVYRDTLVVTAGGSDADPTRVPVEFSIHPCRPSTLTVGSQVSDSVTTRDCSVPHRSDHFGKLYQFSGSAGDSVTISLVSGAVDAYLVLDSSMTGTSTPLAQGDDCRGSAGNACLPYVLLPVTDTFFIEATTSASGETGPFTLSVTPPRPPSAPTVVRQLRSDSVTAIPVGAAVPDSAVVLAATVADPDSADVIVLDVEVVPIRVTFSDIPTDSSSPVAVGTIARATVAGLADDEDYHWRYRSRDETGRTSQWVDYGNNPGDSTDFRVAVPQQPTPPASLGQFRSDATTPVPLGAVVPERTLVFSAVVADPDQGDSLALEVEVRPIGAAFTGTPTGSSVRRSSGSVATVAIAGINDDLGYHWRARTSDQTGLASAWTAFGGNEESAPDFTVDVPATHLGFVQQPTDVAAGFSIQPAVEVRALEASGSVDTAFSATISVNITSGSGTAGAALSGATTKSPTSGVAQYADLSIDSVGTGYTLTATATGLPSAQSDSFAVTEGTAALLRFDVQPNTTVTAGQVLSPAPAASVVDGQGNVVTEFSGNVAVGIVSGTGTAGATLAGTTTVAATAGQVTFSDLVIETAGSGYRLALSSSGLVPDTSTAFAVQPAAAASLDFTVEPSTTLAGDTIVPGVEVTVLDGFGNVVAGYADPITLAIAAGTGTVGAVLGGTTTVAAAAGVAVFDQIVIDSAGANYQLAASSGSLSGTSSVFDVSAGLPTRVVFAVQPQGAAAGAAFAATVAVADSLGNVVDTATNTITVALLSNPGGGTLSGTTMLDAVNGLASFTDLSLDQSGSGYTLEATAAGLESDTSQAFTVGAGAPSQLVFTVGPSTVVAGEAIAPAVEVTVEDANGNTATTYSGDITLSIDNNPGGATLSGGGAVTPSNGVAVFSALILDRAGSGYTLQASATGISGTSAGFDVTPAAAADLVFTSQPASTLAGAAMDSIRVSIVDSLGNLITSSSAPITLALGADPSGGSATLSGTLTRNAVDGVAAFGDISIDRAGSGYTLTVVDGGIGPVESTPFDILVGGGSKLAFTVQPPDVTTDDAFAVTVEVQDAAGNRVATAANDVSLEILANPGAGTLGGTTSIAASSGTAGFTGLSVDRTGAGYTLRATSSGLESDTSEVFDVTAGAAASLVFTQQPTTVTAGAAISPAVRVSVRDAHDNVVTGYSTAIGLAFDNNAGGGTLTGGGGIVPTSGVATFSALSIDSAGTGYTLRATSGTLQSVSNAFDVTPGSPQRLAVQVEPSNTAAGAAVSPSVEIAVLDALGNVVDTSTAQITLAFVNDASDGAATLSGAGPIAAVSGVATFGNLSIDVSAAGYTLGATSASLTGATTAAFDVTPAAASQLAFLQQPLTTIAGDAITPAVRVAVEDAFGNVVTSESGPVTITIGTDPSGGTATLSGTTQVNAVNGVAQFDDLSIQAAASGYTLSASYAGPLSVESDAFDIDVGTGNRLAFIVQPSSTQSGATISPAIEVQVQDGSGNPVTTATDHITLVIASNPSSGTLSGTTSQNAAAPDGVATFDDLHINNVGTGYTLTAFASGLSSATSSAFNITQGGSATAINSITPSTATVTGQAVTVSYGVTAVAPASGTPTGNVTVSAGSDQNTCTVAAGSCVLTFASAGTKSVIATYAGGPNFTGSQSVGTAHQVDQATTSIVLESDAPDPSVSGEDIGVTWSVSVASPGGGTPTGTVTVSDGTDSCLDVAVGAGACTFALTTTGSKTLTATYSGDANYAGDSDIAPHTVNSASTTTAITADSPDPSVVGEPVTVQYTVVAVAPGSGTPTGNVTVSDGGTISCSGTVADGECSLVFPSPGSRSLTASYDGDVNYNASASTAVMHAVNRSASATTIASHTPDPSDVGEAVTIDVSVAPIAPGDGLPTGDVLVSDGTNSCQATLDGIGSGTCDLTLTAAGARSIAASYPGDANFQASADTVTHQVSAAATTTTITSISPSPSVYGGGTVTVGWTVDVVAPGSGTPTGAVTVSDGTDSCNGTVAIPSCAIAFSTAGAKTLTATYAGNTNFAGSSDDSTHQVNRASTTATITSDLPDPSTVDQAFTVTYTVTSTAGTPTGNVTVSDGTDSCVGTVADGSCDLTPTTSGAKTVTASYEGDVNFAPHVSAGVSHQVNPAPVVQFSAATQSVDESVGTAIATVTLSVASGSDISVPFSVNAASTADTLSDYTIASANPLVISAGATSGTISVPVVDDALDETDETLVLTLGTPTNATLGSTTSDTLTIVDNDPPPSVTFAASTQSNAESVSPVEAIVTLSAASGREVSVPFSVGGTATGGGTDYSITGSPAVIPAGATADTITVTVVDDQLTEENETVVLTLGTPVNATAGTPSSDVLTIVDNDPATQLSFTASPPGTIIADSAFSAQVTVLNAFGNVASTFVGDVTVAITSGTGAPGAVLSGTATVAAVAGVADFTGLRIDSPGNAYTLTAAVSGLTDGESGSFTVVGPATSLEVTGIADPVAAGSASDVTITARDVNGNVALAYLGTIDFTSTDAQATLPSSYTFLAGDAGIHTIAGGVTLRTTGEQSVTATDQSDGTITGTQNAITVGAGTANAASSTASVPATGTAGQATGLVITVVDTWGNKVTGEAANLAVVVTGANVGATVAAIVENTGDTTYTTSYTPTVAGNDGVAITLNGGAINGSPFASAVIAGAASADSSTASVPAGAVGNATDVVITVVDTLGNKVSGEAANLVVAVTGANAGATVAAIAENTTDTTYTTSYTPTVAGDDGVAITLNGSPIKGSPYASAVNAGVASADSSTASVPATGTAGQATGLVITVVDTLGNKVTGEAGNLAVTVTGANAGATVAAIAENTTDTTYTTSYTPTVAGNDGVAITLNGGAIKGSPYASVVGAGTANAATTTADVPTTGTAGQATGLVITVVDTWGNKVSGESGNLAVTLTGLNDTVTVAAIAENTTDTTYTTSYVPILAGEDTLTITLGATEIQGSPYLSVVGPGAANADSTTASVPATGTAGQATGLVITVVDTWGNKVSGEAANLAVAVTGANAGATVAAIVEAGDTTYTTSYTPTAAGNDEIAITLDEGGGPVPIGGSPYASVVGAGAATQYLVTASTYAPTAGSNVTITAQLADAYGNPVRTGGIGVSWTFTGDPSASLTKTNSNTLGSGIATTTLQTTTTSGVDYTVTANDGTHSGTSATITTVP